MPLHADRLYCLACDRSFPTNGTSIVTQNFVIRKWILRILVQLADITNLSVRKNLIVKKSSQNIFLTKYFCQIINFCYKLLPKS